jgi:predicted metal-binding membrane protein
VTATALRGSGRTELRLVAVLLAVAAAAWALAASRMMGMDAGPGSELGGVGWFAVSWLVMMAAMMLPALTPMVVAFGRRAPRRALTAAFTAGYLAAWLAAGLIGYAAIAAARVLQLGVLAWNEAGHYLAAGVIAGAGFYQLTPLKEICLRRCRDRRTFLQEHWRPGSVGALRMGTEHGAYCIGCSWALMAALFALGAMSVTWMALVAVLIAAERLLPRTAQLGVALVLLALGTCVALVPGDVPALTVPHAGPLYQIRMH